MHFYKPPQEVYIKSMNIKSHITLLESMGVSLTPFQGTDLTVNSPIDGAELVTLRYDSQDDVTSKIQHSIAAFEQWRHIPMPKRGELLRLFGNALRQHKEQLGQIVTLEAGKIKEEGLGEVQEMIDICDFAVGLSRQLHGLTLPSERPQHAMQENWHPLGVVGIISAFNFPVAVWAWNAALALVCGNAILWKPSHKTPLSAIACQAILDQACQEFSASTGITVPQHLSQIVITDNDGAGQIVHHPDIKLVSATGSCRMGHVVGPQVAQRFGRALLELGGNNAVIVTPSASLDVALPSILFGAVGTAGQRCTSTRRALVHHSIYDAFFDKLHTAYTSIVEHKIGNPLLPQTLVGPLIDSHAFYAMQEALRQASSEGGTVYFGKRALESEFPQGYYTEPALVRMPSQTAIVKNETFAPILYVIPYNDLEEALRLHNDVPQGLSSAIFTTDIREAEYYKQHCDCGIANVNIGTSGAEIGGAFGGEKETGGGRESGSDAWKAYMRRQTSTTYYGQTAPALAQGIKFSS